MVHGVAAEEVGTEFDDFLELDPKERVEVEGGVEVIEQIDFVRFLLEVGENSLNNWLYFYYFDGVVEEGLDQLVQTHLIQLLHTFFEVHYEVDQRLLLCFREGVEGEGVESQLALLKGQFVRLLARL